MNNYLQAEVEIYNLLDRIANLDKNNLLSDKDSININSSNETNPIILSKEQTPDSKTYQIQFSYNNKLIKICRKQLINSEQTYTLTIGKEYDGRYIKVTDKDSKEIVFIEENPVFKQQLIFKKIDSTTKEITSVDDKSFIYKKIANKIELTMNNRTYGYDIVNDVYYIKNRNDYQDIAEFKENLKQRKKDLSKINIALSKKGINIEKNLEEIIYYIEDVEKEIDIVKKKLDYANKFLFIEPKQLEFIDTNILKQLAANLDENLINKKLMKNKVK